MNDKLILTFNAGSSTVKIGLFETDGSAVRLRAKAGIDFRAAPLQLHVAGGGSNHDVDLKGRAEDFDGVLAETFDWLAQHYDMNRVAAAGHRVVHGGDVYAGPALITDASLAEMDKLTALAPLHQPHALRLIRALRRLYPELTQSASFDTAFHATHSPLVRRFAIPRALHDQGVKRYGFHGLSYKFIAGELARRAPDSAKGKVVVAHLGSGASLCAMENGVSRDTSMGFTALDGVPMATRCGAIDPGVLLHLLGPMGRSLEEVGDILYKQSGLLGVSGISADSRSLLASGEPAAKEAIDLFTHRIAGEVSRLASTLGGLDAIVFTAGIGEHQPEIRAGVSARLGWLGLNLDDDANTANAEVISAAGGRIKAFVLATNEEKVIAEEALETLTAA